MTTVNAVSSNTYHRQGAYFDVQRIRQDFQF